MDELIQISIMDAVLVVASMMLLAAMVGATFGAMFAFLLIARHKLADAEIWRKLHLPGRYKLHESDKGAQFKDG